MIKLTKYPIKLGEILYPVNTEVEVVDLDLVKLIFPDVKLNSNSPYVAVRFPNLKNITIVLKKQLNS